MPLAPDPEAVKQVIHYDFRPVTQYFGNGSVKRIATHTINGKELRMKETSLISGYLHFLPDERIKIIYLHSNNFFPEFTLEGNIIVGVTNYRVFKIEKNNGDSVLLKDIDKVKMEENGFFRWDNIVCLLKNGEKKKIGIYYNSTCEYFCNYITKSLGVVDNNESSDTDNYLQRMVSDVIKKAVEYEVNKNVSELKAKL